MSAQPSLQPDVIPFPPAPLRAPPPPLPGPGAPSRAARVVAVGPEGLLAFLPDLEQLAASALEPNVFHEPTLLVPALRAFGARAGNPARIVLVFTADPNPQKPARLAGAFPVERVRRYRGLPFGAWRSWRHKHCFFGAPLVREDAAAEAIGAFLDWAGTGPEGAGVVELRDLPGEGAFHRALLEVLRKRGAGTWTAERHTRALLERGMDADLYLHHAVSGSRRKELRRQEKKLGEKGRVEYLVLKPDDDLDRWLETFLALEAAGWKGKEGSAIAAHGDERRFFETAARAAHARGRLMMLALHLDGVPIAAKCNFLTADGRGSFAFKIAFDESLAKLSPGVLLELENVRALHGHPTLRWMDSCAAADHPMIDHLWSERRSIETLVVSTGKRRGDLIASALPLLAWTRKKLARKK